MRTPKLNEGEGELRSKSILPRANREFFKTSRYVVKVSTTVLNFFSLLCTDLINCAKSYDTKLLLSNEQQKTIYNKHLEKKY